MADEDYVRYDMLYCDSMRCRVNTFERGIDSECPGCGSTGLDIPGRME